MIYFIGAGEVHIGNIAISVERVHLFRLLWRRSNIIESKEATEMFKTNAESGGSEFRVGINETEAVMI